MAHFAVAVRCKPSAESKAWRVDESNLYRVRVTTAGPPEQEAGEKAASGFDHAFTEEDGHADVYERAVAPLVGGCLQTGANVGVVMYGLPCTGKTHTVFGTSGQLRVKQEARGVIIRCGQQLLEEMEGEKQQGKLFRLTATFCHVFEDGRVADLLDTKKRDLGVSEDRTTALYSVPNLTETNISTEMDVVRLVEKGYLMRNATSCRKDTGGSNKLALKAPTTQPLQQYRQHTSHALFRFTLEQVDMHPRGDYVQVLKVAIVDLAGQPIEQHHRDAVCSDSGIETLHSILRRLPTEGIVTVANLFSKSNLTKLLKQYFGGNCRTLLLGNVCLTKSSASAEDKCLQLLQLARGIKNYSKPLLIPANQSVLGQTLNELDSLKNFVSEKLGLSMPVESWEISSEGNVKANGNLYCYSELTASCKDLVGQITSLEHGIIEGGKPGAKQSTVGVRPRGSRPPSSSGAAMVRPVRRPMSSTATPDPSQAMLPPSTSTTAADRGNKSMKDTSKKNRGSEGLIIHSHSTSSLDTVSSSSSDDEPATPIPLLVGPPPPPLRGIPHIKPDSDAAANIMPTVTPVLSQSHRTEAVPKPSLPPSISSAPLRRQSAPFPLQSRPRLDTSVPDQQQAKQPNVSVMPTPSSGVILPKPPPVAKDTPIQVLPGKNRRASMPPSTAAMSSKGTFSSQSTSSWPEPITTQAANRTLASIPKVKPSLHRQVSEDSSAASVSPNPTSGLGHTNASVASHIKDVTPENSSIANQVDDLSLTSDQTGITQSITGPISDESSYKDAPVSTQVQAGDYPPPSQLPRVPLVAVKPVPPTFPPGSQLPRGPLGPIRPMGMVPSLHYHPQVLSSHQPIPMRSGGHSSSSSSSSISSSSLSLTESSESDHFDEARDTFHPEMQYNQLTVQHNLQRLGVNRRTILPPISHNPTYSHSHPLSPHALTTAQPPSYDQAGLHSFNNSRTTAAQPPGYFEQAATMNREGESSHVGAETAVSGDTAPPDTSELLSSDEIHVAALEGVKTSLMKRLVHQFGVDHKDRGGRTPLMYAVLGNQPKMCEVLISLGASINTCDSSGFTPLLWATYHARPQVMRTLVRSGANLMVSDTDGRTVFHWAVKTPQIQCLKLLCKHAESAIVNKPDNEGLTPLHWAVMCDQAVHVRVLLASTSVDFSAKDREGRTPLNYAVLNFSPDCIKAILDCRESAVNLTDEKGRTALHYACAEGSVDCVRTLLLYRCCNLHCTDNRGTTPLHWAAAANQPGLIQLLLRRGADRAQQDRDGMTALNHAEQRGHAESARILRTYGLRRPSSVLSIASHVSVPSAAHVPDLDDQGHILFKRPKRRFSLSGVSVSSMEDGPRQPADGQAHAETGTQSGSEDTRSREGRREDRVGEPAGGAESTGDLASPSTRWAFAQHSPTGSQQQVGSSQGHPRSGRRRRRRRLPLSLCSCLGGARNAVVPTDPDPD